MDSHFYFCMIFCIVSHGKGQLGGKIGEGWEYKESFSLIFNLYSNSFWVQKTVSLMYGPVELTANKMGLSVFIIFVWSILCAFFPADLNGVIPIIISQQYTCLSPKC